MTALSPAFQDHLDTGTTTLAWAWRITRSDGAIYGFTDHDADLIFDGTTFESETGLIASEIRQSADLAVDAQDAEGILVPLRRPERRRGHIQGEPLGEQPADPRRRRTVPR